MKKRRKTVWVVMHYEYTRTGDALVIDCLQFHVSSSLKKAEEYIRSWWVYPFSWWQVHPHLVDDDDVSWTEGKRVFYYSHKGTSLRAAPFKRAENAFKRDEEKNRERS
jgi:hypothetical protein